MLQDQTYHCFQLSVIKKTEIYYSTTGKKMPFAIEIRFHTSLICACVVTEILNSICRKYDDNETWHQLIIPESTQKICKHTENHLLLLYHQQNEPENFYVVPGKKEVKCQFDIFFCSRQSHATTKVGEISIGIYLKSSWFAHKKKYKIK